MVFLCDLNDSISIDQCGNEWQGHNATHESCVALLSALEPCLIDPSLGLYLYPVTHAVSTAFFLRFMGLVLFQFLLQYRTGPYRDSIN